jgi:hypothetical protein
MGTSPAGCAGNRVFIENDFARMPGLLKSLRCDQERFMARLKEPFSLSIFF